MATTITISTPLSRREATTIVANLPVDGSHEVCIRKTSKNRSVRQNNLYWEWMSIISQSTGHSVEELHNFFKRKFLGLQSRDVLGECIVTVKDSHNLSTVEFNDYMAQVLFFCEAELGIELPAE